MSSENCKCLISHYDFFIFKKENKWLPAFLSRLPIETKSLIIHGESLDEIELKRDEIKNQLEKKYGEGYYVVVHVK